MKRIHTPTVIQMEAVECGAAALSIILGYYKCFVTLEELRIACGVSRDGSNASNMMKAAEHYGLDTRAYKKEVEDLYSLKPPYIIFWEFNHFVVVDHMAKKEVFINDPALGPRSVSIKEFSNSFTGIVMVFRPNEKFQKRGSPPSVIDALKKRLKNIRPIFLYLSIVQFSILIPTLAMASLSHTFIDKVFTDKNPNWIAGLIAGMIASAIFSSILIWFQETCLYKLKAFLSIVLSNNFFNYILKLPINFYQQRSSGDIAWRIQLNDIVIDQITQKIARAFLNAALVLIYAIIMLICDWIAACTVIIGGLLNVLLLIYINRSRSNAMARLIQKYLHMTGFAVNGLQNMETIKSLGLENDFFSKWAGHNSEWISAHQDFDQKNNVLQTLSPFFNTLTKSSLICVGAFLIMKGEMSIGALVGIQIVAQRFLDPLNELVQLGQTTQEVKVNLQRLDDSLENRKDELFEETPTTTKPIDNVVKLKCSLEMKNVTFGYNRIASPFIDNFNLNLEPKKVIALVGHTGCGKSTIAKLALGLFHPWNGTITYDGYKRKELPQYLIHNSISFVDQDILLFSASIKDNITLWNSAITDKDIVEAAKDACIHERILMIEEGYNYILEEGGLNLSGGERQRIEIARALATNPSLLILDEATSSLDSITEAEILKNIKHRGSACIIVAHRLSTIKNADEIIVLDKGKIVQKGPHEVLKAEEGLYKELIKVRGE